MLIVTSNHSNGFCRQCTSRRTATGILFSQGLYVNISVFDLSGKPAVKCFRAERLALKSCQGFFFSLISLVRVHLRSGGQVWLRRNQ